VETGVGRPIRLSGLEFEIGRGRGWAISRVILKLDCCPDLEMCADWCRYRAKAKEVYFLLQVTGGLGRGKVFGIANMMKIRRNGLKPSVRVLRARRTRIWELVTNEQGIDLSAFGTKYHDD